MTDDTRLLDLVRSAMPPVVAISPSRDLWPSVLKRSANRRRWSWVDVALAIAAATALAARRELLVFLAYHF